MWMLSIVLARLAAQLMGDRDKALTLEQPDGPVIGPAQTSARLDDLVEHRLELGRSGERTKETADRPLLLAQSLELALDGSRFLLRCRVHAAQRPYNSTGHGWGGFGPYPQGFYPGAVGTPPRPPAQHLVPPGRSLPEWRMRGHFGLGGFRGRGRRGR